MSSPDRQQLICYIVKNKIMSIVFVTNTFLFFILPYKKYFSASQP